MWFQQLSFQFGLFYFFLFPQNLMNEYNRLKTIYSIFIFMINKIFTKETSFLYNKNWNHLWFDIHFTLSRWIETMCLPGTMTSPKTRAAWCSSERNSEQDPRMMLASLSVHKNAPIKIRPSVILIFRNLFNQLLSFCFCTDGSVGSV